jgi:hypothetical protein
VLRVKVSDAERLRQARPYTKSLPPYEAFPRAQSALIVRRQPENEEARQLAQGTPDGAMQERYRLFNYERFF